MKDLQHWTGVPHPERKVLEGQYVRLEPLDADRHGRNLYMEFSASGADQRFRYTPAFPPKDEQEFYDWAQKAQLRVDPLFFAVIDKESGHAVGRLSIMRIDTANGTAEIGNVMWGPSLAKTRGATEAVFLLADYVFSLGYRRLEWKCDNNNEASKHAALRFGFRYEGLFRQHRVVKGLNRDTAWFAMTDGDWETSVHNAFTAWLDPSNFDDEGNQHSRLAARHNSEE